jgi:hypothetical protein
MHLWVLAWLGAFLGHQLGYGVASAAEWSVLAPDHRYLAGFASLVPPLLIGAIALSAVAMVRQRIDLGAAGVATLALAQVAAFMSVEAVEFALAGELASLHVTPAVWLGAVLQPLVAWMLVRVIRLTAGMVARVHRSPGAEPAIGIGHAATLHMAATSELRGRRWSPKSPRGPPLHP